ncbi:MAG TPA: ABC transporter permease [Thermoanaerobaculia bacterium]|nr:ABC transporter permease [Thermoanaerobaculia bacterium]
MKLWELIRYEAAALLRRYSTAFFAAALIGMTLIAAMSFLDDARQDGVLLNAPMVTAGCMVIVTMLGMLVTAALAGEAATRDLHARMEPLLYTAPLRRSTYLGGHFLGAFAAASILFAIVPLTLVAAVHLPAIEPSFLGAFHPLAYLKAYALIAVPNAFVTTALFFSLVVLSRRALTGYLGATVLFIATIVNEEVLATHFGQWDLARQLDPFGFIIVKALWHSWTTTQRNAMPLALDGALLTNRLLWIGVSLVALTFVHARFRMAHDGPVYGWFARRRRVMPEEATPSIAPMPVSRVRGAFTRATRVRQLIAIGLRSYRELMTSRAALLIPALGFFLFVTGPQLLDSALGTPGRPATGRLAMLYANFPVVALAISVMIAFFAGELVWRERDAREHDIADVMPVPEALSFAGKFTALALLLVTLQATLLITGMLTQIAAGYSVFEFGLWARVLFGWKLLDALLFAALAMAVHVVINQKYVAIAVAVLAATFVAFASELGIDNHQLIFGSAPRLGYSQLSGFGTLAPWLWYKSFWAGWALLFALLARLFWVRGQESGFARRLMLARRRFTRVSATVGAIAIASITSTGAFIAYNTLVLNPRVDARKVAAEYERRYGQYAALAQPLVAATKLVVEFHPAQQRAEVHGTYTLENRSGRAIDTIHLLTHRTVPTTNVTFDRAARATLVDNETGYRIYKLSTPLAAGQSLQLSFDVRYAPHGFSNDGVSDAVTENGSRIEYASDSAPSGRNWLPVVGYRRSAEIDNAGDRRAYGLPPRAALRSLHDAAAPFEEAGREHVSLETIIGTDADQTAVAPGALRRSWTANGRRYFHYVTDAPIRNGFPILSARYAVHREQWNGIDIEVLHDPAHAWNAARIARAAKASLATYSRLFGPYPQRQLRLVEYASSGMRLTSHPGTIVWSEGFAYAQAEADGRQIDFPFAVVAHEVAHQWWGNQLVPARVEGSPLLSESLSWYSAMQVIEETFGRDHLDRVLQVMRAEYLQPRATADVPLLRSSDHFAVYRSGPFAMFALRETIGANAMNAALRALFEEYRDGKPPLPTSLDLYRHLRAVTPASSQTLLKDLFEEITYWDLKMKAVRVTRERAAYRVAIDVEAYKLKVGGAHEVRVPMNDAVELAVFGEHDVPLYRAVHHLHAGVQTIAVTVPKAPVSAGVDPRFTLLDRDRDDNVKVIAR